MQEGGADDVQFAGEVDVVLDENARFLILYWSVHAQPITSRNNDKPANKYANRDFQELHPKRTAHTTACIRTPGWDLLIGEITIASTRLRLRAQPGCGGTMHWCSSTLGEDGRR